MEKITVTKEDLLQSERLAENACDSPVGEARASSWVRLLLFPFVLLPPLLCVMALALWLVLRKKSPELRAVWTGYLCWLLIVSGVAGSVSVALLLSQKSAPAESPTLTSLNSLDAINDFPSAAADKELTPPEIASKYKRFVFVVYSPNSQGSCVLLSSDIKGHFFLTCRHVVDGKGFRTQKPHRSTVLLTSEKDETATAQIVGRHTSLDLALLWIPRHHISASFSLPVREFSKIQVGEPIFVIGHPQGLLFTMSTGIVSQKRNGNVIQISAPTSPGNSGGPIFDSKGRLLGILTSGVRSTEESQAQNLNFADRADAVFETQDWILNEAASAKLRELNEQSKKAGARSKAKADSPPDSGKKNQ